MDEIRQTLRWQVGDAEYALIGAAEGWTFVAPDATVDFSTETLVALARAIALARTAPGPVRRAGPSARPTQRSRAGKPWTAAEDLELRDQHATGMSHRAMAKEHERSPGAIASRLVLLGLVEGSGVPPRHPGSPARVEALDPT